MKNATKIGSMAWVICALALAALPVSAEDADRVSPEAVAAPGEAGEAGEAAAEAISEPLSGRVARARFTTAVVDREPQDAVTRLANDASQIHFYTEFRGLAGHTLTHVWERDGVEMARVPFAVDGPRWRVYSSKRLDPSWLGEWSVSVVDAEGRVLASESFAYVAAEAPPAAEATAAPDAEPEPAAVPAAID